MSDRGPSKFIAVKKQLSPGNRTGRGSKINRIRFNLCEAGFSDHRQIVEFGGSSEGHNYIHLRVELSERFLSVSPYASQGLREKLLVPSGSLNPSDITFYS